MSILEKNCRQCYKLFEKAPTCSLKEWNEQTKFCSKECYWDSKFGKPPWNKGLTKETDPRLDYVRPTQFCDGFKHSQVTIQKFKARIGEKNPSWKGDFVSRAGLHIWLKRKLGSPLRCEICGASNTRFAWANKSGKYLRKLSDWLQLCYFCHWHYDKDSRWNKLRQNFITLT